MAYSLDPATGDIIINGFENGIGASPYSGLTDLKSVNPSSVSGEASVSFSTKAVFNNANYTTGIVATSAGVSNVFNLTGGDGHLLENNMAIFVSASTVSGIAANTMWWIDAITTNGTNTTFDLVNQYTDYRSNPGTGPSTGTSGSFTFTTLKPALVKYFTKSRSSNWMVDSNGLVWSDTFTTGGSSGSAGVTATNSWTWTGNTGYQPLDSSANGNGVVCYQSVTDSTGGLGTSAGVDEWIFCFRNSQIDYVKITANGVSAFPSSVWHYGWEPSAGTTGNTQYLQSLATINNSHQAIVTPDGRVDYCDANFISVFYQNVPTPGSNYTGFNPTTQASYTFSTYTILPFNDTAQCIAFLNASLLVGGKSNIVYPWDLTSPTYSTPLIQLPENNIQSIVNVGNNGYIFAGNRGWIYQTNGSQASPYKKVPDHLSGAVEPLISWGGSVAAGSPTGTATFNKNRLYFGCQVSLQAGGSATGYGGIWCIDLNTGSIYNSNQMSYGTYAGYVSALMVSSAQTNYSPSIGYGLLAGWNDGMNTLNFGVDASIAAPYTNGASIIVSDLIPVGTLLHKLTPYQFEVKTSMPLLTNETIVLSAGYSIADYTTGNMTTIGTVSGGANTHGDSVIVSGNLPTLVENQQWLIVQATLTGIASNPSYNRVTQIRVIGDTIKTQVPGQPYANA